MRARGVPFAAMAVLAAVACAQRVAAVEPRAPSDRLDAAAPDQPDAPWVDVEDADREDSPGRVADVEIADDDAGEEDSPVARRDGGSGAEVEALDAGGSMLPDGDDAADLADGVDDASAPADAPHLADASAPEPCAAGAERCGTRVCAPEPCDQRTPRPLAPIAALRVHTARPWFRWELPTGAEGARVEVCATPRCDVVEGSWEASGTRLRPPVALRPGVHFWRLTARREGHIAAAAGPVWAFAVDLTLPAPETQQARRDALLDVNGDGVEEQVEGPAVDPSHLSWSLDLVLSGTSPPVRQRFEGSFGYRSEMPGTRPRGRSYALQGLYPIGDVNGDGYGDLLLAEQQTIVEGGGDLTVDLHLGGRDGLRGGPQRLADPLGWGLPIGAGAGLDVIAAGDVDGDGYGDALLDWYVRLGFQKLLVGGADRARVADGCTMLVGWIGHGDVDADGFEDLMATSVTRSTWSDWAFAFQPGGPDAARAARCGVVARSLGVAAPLRLAPGVRAHVFDENDDGYDDVLIDNDVGGDEPFHIFRGGPAGIPFSE